MKQTVAVELTLEQAKALVNPPDIYRDWLARSLAKEKIREALANFERQQA